MASREFELMVQNRDGTVGESEIDEMNLIQNEKAKRFLKEHTKAVAGKINWHCFEERGYKNLSANIPLFNYSFDFAIPKADNHLMKLLETYNNTPWTTGKNCSNQLTVMFNRITNLRGIFFYWI